MAGQYGNVNKTIQNLTVLQINEVDDLLYIKGSVPGPKNGYLTVRDAIKSILPDNVLKPAGLKDNKKPETNNSEPKKVVPDSEAKSVSEDVNVKNEELNDKKANEQSVTTEKSSNIEITDADKNVDNKEV